MARSKGIPSYRLHKQSGQAVVTLSDPSGRRKDVLLGKYGSAESRVEYARVLQEWEAQDRKLSPESGPHSDLTVSEFVARFWHHAEIYYGEGEGKLTRELREFRMALRPLNFLHGAKLVLKIGPLALDSVRNLMIRGYEHPEYGPQEAISRGVINQRMGRIKRAFKWGVQMELLPGSVYHGILAVQGLKRGHTEARETEPVKPVAVPFVEATIAKAAPTIADMIRLQLLTGIRPGELVIMRGVDLDTTGTVWLYRPEKHKTAHHGHTRVIAIGPQAQTIIRRYLKPDVQAPLFSPREAREARYRAMRALRKTPVQPSQVCRKKAKPQKLPGEQYDVTGYAKAITRAAKAADVPHWHPHQLRHTRATEIRRMFGIDAARAILGHRSPAITEVYAELDQGQAVEIMAKIG
jgi:integrase